MNLRELALDSTYHDVERLLCQMCWAYAKKYGGTFHEWLSEANEGFMNAAATYDPKSGAFTTWVWYQVRGRLANCHRKRVRQQEMEVNTEDLSRVPNRNGRLDMERFLVDLSEDSKTVMRLIINSPPEWLELAKKKKTAKLRRCLWTELRRMGWAAGRVLLSFDEIQEALTP